GSRELPESFHVLPATTNTSRYAAAVFRKGELHITPLQGILQMRPSFTYLDRADGKQREREAANEGSPRPPVPRPPVIPAVSQRCLEEGGKVNDGSMLGDANGLEPGPGRVKDSGKWQKPRFSRKALMKCCLVKWIIASTQHQDNGERLAVTMGPVACCTADTGRGGRGGGG
ncbi:hypothetical protein CRUP_022400, partial [Coryphaenoides rupestris]